MTRLFRLRSAHGSYVALDLRLEALVAITSPPPPDIVPIVASRLDTRPAVIALTAEVQETWRFYVHPLSDCRSSIMLFRLIGNDTVALMHPFSGKFVTATPTPNAPLHNTAEQVREWEWFDLEPIEPAALSAGAARRLERAERLLAAPPTARLLSDSLAEGAGAADMLNACLPFMPTNVIDEFASNLLSHPAARQLLAGTFLGDLWANLALPDLAGYLDRKSRNPPEEAGANGTIPQRTGFMSRWLGRPVEPPRPMMLAAPEPPRSRLVGSEFDRLGTAGLTGGFTSFPHACVLRARRNVAPERRIAIIATARNEGIYLLEWIAHHRLLGVEEFFIYSNDNDDGSDELLAALADAGEIIWINNRLDPARGNAQFKAYGHALSCLPDVLDYQWALLIDLDEFMILDPAVFPDIGAFCDWHRDRGADTVAINWAFLRSEDVPATSQIPLPHRNQRLLTAAEMGEGVRLVKSMSRPNRVCHSEAHVPFTDERSGLVQFHAGGRPHRWHNPPAGFRWNPKFSDNIDGDVAVIYHYIFKSAEEWLWKSARNPGDHRLTANAELRVVDQGKVRHFLAQHDAPNLAVTRRAVECVSDLAGEIERIKSLPRIGPSYRQVMSRYEEKLTRIKSAYARSEVVRNWESDTKRFLDLAGIK